MESRTNGEQLPAEDAKALVVALTEQLRINNIGETDQRNTAASIPARTTLGATVARNEDITRNSSSDINDNFYDHVEESFPLPDFLAESNVRAALHRAVNAHSQEAFSDEAPPRSHFPNLRPMELGGQDSGRQTLMARDFHPSLWHAALPHPPSPITPLLSQEGGLDSAGVSSKFVPGNETDSVLKLTKRPRLRPKDVSHRRSLGSDQS
jgi:hypothetical protein